MNPWINYHHLLYFKTVAEEGSVSKAAEKLRIGQPTLSSQLKQFEENIGVQLFERKHKKLTLSEHGKVALEYAKVIFRTGNEMYEVLHNQTQSAKLDLHIGALDGIPKTVVVKIVQSALKSAPCRITLSEGKQDELFRELSAHRMDLLITNYLPTGSNSQNLRTRLISKKSIAFYGSKNFLKLKNNFPESLSNVPLILPTYDSRLRQDLEHWFELNNIEINLLVESQDVATKKNLAQESYGLMAAADYSVKEDLQNKDLYYIGEAHGVNEELYMVAFKRKVENKVVGHLLKTVSL